MEELLKEQQVSASGKKQRKKVKPEVKTKLWLKAGGICSFRGCQSKLDEHHLTLEEANFSNIAHIVSYEPGGPRGDSPLTPEERNEYDNLMLVCTVCHKLVDTKEHENKYPVELLKEFKKEHEANMEFAREYVTRKERTHLIRCQANVREEVVKISQEEMFEAIQPRNCLSKNFTDLDMTKFPGLDTPEYWGSKKQDISQAVGRLFSREDFGTEINHVSVFPMGPMPLLMHLGNCLSNKVRTDLYQRHRDTESWKWKNHSKEVTFKFHKLQDGKNDLVCLVMSLSGQIQKQALPEELIKDATIYEITVDSESPSLTFLNSKEILESLKTLYRNSLSEINNYHPQLEKIHFFPAMPAPVAVMCGRELLHKADPILRIYDYDKVNNTFNYTMETNDGR